MATFLPDASDMAGVVEPGTYAVGSEIAPGIYVGEAEEGSLCTWKKLGSLDEDAVSTMALASHQGLFYVEVLASDIAFATSCELSPLEYVLPRAELLKSVPTDMYIVGRDIAPGLYKGEASPGPSCAPGRDLMV